MTRTFQLTLALALIGVCVSAAGQQRQAVFAQDNAPVIHQGPIYRAEPKPSTTTGLPKPTPPPIDCSIREDGSYLPSNIPCSRLYYTCSHGVSRFHWCPSNTVFNTEKGECDFYEHVNSCPPIQKITPKPTTPKPTTPSSNSTAGVSPQSSN